MASYEDVVNHLYKHLQPLAEPGFELDESTDLTTSLGLDSHTVMELLFEIEDEFDILVPMNALTDVQTVGDLASVIHGLIEEK